MRAWRMMTGLLLAMGLAASTALAAVQPLQLGVFAYRDKADTETRWRPLAEHLSRAIGVRIELRVLDTGEIKEALRQNTLDFVFTTPRHYVELKQENALSGALATLVERQNNQPVAALGGAIVIRRERADIQTLADLRGKKIAIPAQGLLGAHAVQLYELARAGVQLAPGQFMETGLPYDRAVQAVISGSADAGFVRTGIFEHMVEEGKVAADALRVINRQDLPGFPFQSSTRLYPEWPLVSLPQVDQKLARRLASALLAIEPDDAVARAARFYGFTIPADYQPVEDLMRELRLPPFDRLPPITWRDLREQHGLVLAALGASVLIVFVLLIGLLFNTRRLRAARRATEANARQLASEHRQLRTLIETLPDLVWLKDSDGVYLACNPEFEKFYGAIEAAIIGKTDYDFVGKELADFFRANDRAAAAAGKPRMNEEWLTFASDGYHGLFETVKTPMLGADGQIIGVLGVARDISKTRADRYALQERMKELACLYAVFQLTEDPASALPDMLQAVVERIPAALQHPEYAAACIQFDGRRLASADFFDTAWRIDIDFAGIPDQINRLSVIYGDLPPDLADPQSDPFFSEEREMLAAIGERLASVIKNRRADAELDQHRHRLEELVGERTRQYEAARDAAETANRAKSVFLANMSHEIRTPLNAIIGLTHLVQSDLAEQPKQQQRLGKVGEAARHLLAIINDILDLSKIEAGRLTLESIDFTLSGVIGEVSDLLRDPLSEKGLSWQVAIDPALPPHLKGDPLRLGQVLINFTSNAVKFTAQGGVKLAVTRLSAAGDALWLRFEIADTGIGLTPAATARLFEPFEQADMSTTRRFGGTGLGLAIVKRIADLMGGRVGVVSTPGKGSTFWLEAPFGTGQTPVAADVPAPVSGRDVWGAAGAATGDLANGFADHAYTRILLAEDNPINREVALDLLDAVGLHADVAENGREALECARTHCYALILMDVQMPEMDGIEATRQIRALVDSATAADVPIIAMTANVFSADRRNCLDAGMSDHLPKPVTPVDFYRMLQRWLPTATGNAQQKVGAGGTATGPVFPVMPAAPVAPPRLPDIPGLDTQAGLLYVGGSAASYQRLLGMFVEHHANGIAQIRAALSAGQRDEARRLAHSLKGAAATLGADPLSSAAAAAELAIKSGVADEEIEADLMALEAPLDALVNGLRIFMDGGT